MACEGLHDSDPFSPLSFLSLLGPQQDPAPVPLHVALCLVYLVPS